MSCFHNSAAYSELGDQQPACRHWNKGWDWRCTAGFCRYG